MLDRRAFLGRAAGFALLAGCGGNAITPKPKPGLPWNALAKKLAGRVVPPGDTGFIQLSRSNNLRYAFRYPAGIALCKNANDVATSILWARENNVPLGNRQERDVQSVSKRWCRQRDAGECYRVRPSQQPLALVDRRRLGCGNDR